MSWRNDIRAGREKEGDSVRTSARQGSRDREERWGKAIQRAVVNVGQKRRIWEREERVEQEEQRAGGDWDIRWEWVRRVCPIRRRARAVSQRLLE